MQYQCSDCEMTVKGLTCGKCDAQLVHGELDVDGQMVQVSTCPNDCGKIKSPQCCGHDMQVSSD